MSVRIRKPQVCKRPGSACWYVRYWEPGLDGRWKQIWRSSKSLKKADAEKLRRKIEGQLEAGMCTRDGDMPWTVFVEEFLTKHVVRKAFESRRLYDRCLRRFGQAMKPRHLASVTVAMLEDYANLRLEDGVAGATVNKELRHLRAALNWAQRREYIGRVPRIGGILVRVDAKQPVTIPEADFLAMVRALPRAKLQRCSADWWRVFLYVSYYLGTRLSETLGLTWDRVRFEALEVVIAAQTSKGRKDRVVPMSKQLAKVLRAWRNNQPTLTLGSEVLPWTHTTYRQVYEDWHAIQEAAGIPEGRHYVPKNCRSACASELIAAGVPTAVVQRFLGHQSIVTTQRYYLNVEPALRAAADARKVRLA